MVLKTALNHAWDRKVLWFKSEIFLKAHEIIFSFEYFMVS